jgi:hypothetical protein
LGDPCPPGRNICMKCSQITSDPDSAQIN